MTPEREAEIRARLAATTPGPWEVDRKGHNPGHWTIRCGRMDIAYGMSWRDPPVGSVAIPWPQGDANAALIANVPRDLADLLAALDEARARVHALTQALYEEHALKDAARREDFDAGAMAEREACAAYLRETAAGLVLAATDCATSAERRRTLCAADELARAADAIRARGSLNP